MKAWIPVLLAALIAFPPRAFAEGPGGRPRVVERGDRICLQTLAADGTVVEECRDRVLAPTGSAPAPRKARTAEPASEDDEFAAEDEEADEAEAAKAPTPDPEPAWIAEYRLTMPQRLRPPGLPENVAREQADEDASGGAFLAGGLAAGCLTGLFGTAIVALIGFSSDPQPPDVGRWDTVEDERTYLRTYRHRVRTIEVRNAVIGGVIGTTVAVAAFVFLTLNQAPAEP